MKKRLLMMVSFLLSGVLLGCDLFLQGYLKDEVTFQKNMIEHSMIETEMDMDVIYYPQTIHEFNLGVDMDIIIDMNTNLALVDLSTMGENISLLIDASGDEIIGYQKDQFSLSPITKEELDTLFNESDLSMSDANAFTVGRFANKMTQNEDGSYQVTFPVSDVNEDDDLYELFASLESEGLNIDDLDDKSIVMTVDFNDDFTEMVMEYDIDEFDVVVESQTVPMKMAMSMTMKKADIDEISMNDYRIYPIADKEDVKTVLSQSDSIQGVAFYGSNGYFKMNLSSGSYEVSNSMEGPVIKIMIFDANNTQIEHDIYGRYVIPSNGTYYINVIGYDEGYFEFTLSKK